MNTAKNNSIIQDLFSHKDQVEKHWHVNTQLIMKDSMIMTIILGSEINLIFFIRKKIKIHK
jgi:hypothetical protein